MENLTENQNKFLNTIISKQYANYAYNKTNDIHGLISYNLENNYTSINEYNNALLCINQINEQIENLLENEKIFSSCNYSNDYKLCYIFDLKNPNNYDIRYDKPENFVFDFNDDDINNTLKLTKKSIKILKDKLAIFKNEKYILIDTEGTVLEAKKENLTDKMYIIETSLINDFLTSFNYIMKSDNLLEIQFKKSFGTIETSQETFNVVKTSLLFRCLIVKGLSDGVLNYTWYKGVINCPLRKI